MSAIETWVSIMQSWQRFQCHSNWHGNPGLVIKTPFLPQCHCCRLHLSYWPFYRAISCHPSDFWVRQICVYRIIYVGETPIEFNSNFVSRPFFTGWHLESHVKHGSTTPNILQLISSKHSEEHPNFGNHDFTCVFGWSLQCDNAIRLMTFICLGTQLVMKFPGKLHVYTRLVEVGNVQGHHISNRYQGTQWLSATCLVAKQNGWMTANPNIVLQTINDKSPVTLSRKETRWSWKNLIGWMVFPLWLNRGTPGVFG